MIFVGLFACVWVSLGEYVHSVCVCVCVYVCVCVAVWCSVLQCVAVCCSVLQCLAVCQIETVSKNRSLIWGGYN